MATLANDSGMDSVLTLNGDVCAAHEHTYLLGSVLRSGQSPRVPLACGV